MDCFGNGENMFSPRATRGRKGNGVLPSTAPRNVNARYVSSKDTTPNTKALLVRHLKNDTNSVFVRTWKGSKFDEVEAAEVDIKAAVNESVDLNTNHLIRQLAEERETVHNLTDQVGKQNINIAKTQTELTKQTKRVEKLAHENIEMATNLEKQISMLRMDQVKSERLQRTMEQNEELEDRVSHMEQVLSIDITNRLERAKKTLLDMPDTPENRKASLAILEDIRKMEHLIFFTLQRWRG